MNRIAICLMTAIATVSICGCGCLRSASKPVVISDRTERITEHVTMVTVRPTFKILPVNEVHRGVCDTVDVIENDYAVSSVHINPDGTYDHSMRSKPQTISDSLEVPLVSRDSTCASRDVQLQYVDKHLPCWQKTLICLGILFLALAFIIITLSISKLFKQ